MRLALDTNRYVDARDAGLRYPRRAGSVSSRTEGIHSTMFAPRKRISRPSVSMNRMPEVVMKALEGTGGGVGATAGALAADSEPGISGAAGSGRPHPEAAKSVTRPRIHAAWFMSTN
jgi:hypothetical protein